MPQLKKSRPSLKAQFNSEKTQSAAQCPTCKHFMQNDWLNVWLHYQTPRAKCQQDLGTLWIFLCYYLLLGLLLQSLAMSGA